MEHSDQLGFNLKDVLKKLDKTELNNFKSTLKSCSLPQTMKQISKLTMDLANGAQLAEILTDYCPNDWVKRVTFKILEEINRADLAELVMKQVEVEWSESKQAQSFSCAFYISCRKLNNSKPCTFAHLLSMNNPSWRYYMIRRLVLSEQFLFVVDGFDELTFPAGALLRDICGDWNTVKPVEVLLSSLLMRKMEPHSTLLVTTQTQSLHQIYLMVDQPVLVETQGFLEPEKQEYFQQYFEDEEGEEEGEGEGKALRALKEVKCNEALFQMASLPAACGIFCLCLELGMKKGEDLALTCQTYTSMFLNFLCRVFLQEACDGHLNKQLQILFKKICILAADSLLEQVPILCEEDFLKLKLNLNKLHPVVYRCIFLEDSSCTNCLSFICLSIQQLLAAIIFVQELGQESKDVSKYSIQKMLSREARLKNPNLSGVLPFVFSLLNKTHIQELETIFGCQISMGVKRKFLECELGENKPFLLLMDLQEIFSCLYESQEEEFVKEAMALFGEVSLHLKTNMDLVHASFCLKNSQNLQTMFLKVEKAVFPENFATLESTAEDQRFQDKKCMLTLWTDFCDTFHSNEKLAFLEIHESFLNSSSLEILCEKLSSAPCHLQKVVLKNISPDDAYEKLCLIFCGYETISHLTLQGGKLDSMLHSLCKVVKNPACNLKFLRLENCHLTEVCCKDLSSVLMVSQTLTHLSLAKNELGDNGVKKLCESLSFPKCKLQTLVLWSCNITSNGCHYLSKMLGQAPSLKHLDLGLNRIGTTGAKFLCEALKSPRSNLKSLWLCGCSIIPTNCKDFSEILRSNKSLNTLDLSQNVMGTDAVKIFCESLKLQICPLQTLRLKFDEANPSIQKLIQEMKESHPQLSITSDQVDPKKKSHSFPHFIF
ncbi:rCG22685 [Rattus norvegicus]|uniref:RCG22685 n=1 Tax=Rattus norvegicus TaxID=10116 RepID=A6KNL0_RAT|nr:rCG22685 [Rattus norvegicus]